MCLLGLFKLIKTSAVIYGKDGNIPLILVHIEMIASHCWLHTTTFHRWSVGLRSADCGGRLEDSELIVVVKKPV